MRDGAAQVRTGGVLAVVAGARTVAATVAFCFDLAQAWRFEDARLQWFRAEQVFVVHLQEECANKIWGCI